MAADQLTLELSGAVSLPKFAEAMKRFQALIADLSKEIGKEGGVNWQVQDLNYGSAITTVQGRGRSPDEVERIVIGYGHVGVALAQRTNIPYSEKVQRSANSLANVVGGGVTALRFETTFIDAVVGPQTNAARDTPSITYAYGAIKGTVETLTTRRGLRFTLYDQIFDRPISCYLQDTQQQDMREAWGRSVIVSGIIGREPATRRPVVVRDIQNIEIVADVSPGSFRLARGALGAHDESLPSELIIRSMRDAE